MELCQREETSAVFHFPLYLPVYKKHKKKKKKKRFLNNHSPSTYIMAPMLHLNTANQLPSKADPQAKSTLFRVLQELRIIIFSKLFQSPIYANCLATKPGFFRALSLLSEHVVEQGSDQRNVNQGRGCS